MRRPLCCLCNELAFAPAENWARLYLVLKPAASSGSVGRVVRSGFYKKRKKELFNDFKLSSSDLHRQKCSRGDPPTRPAVLQPACEAAELFPSCSFSAVGGGRKEFGHSPVPPAPRNTHDQILMLSKQLEASSRCSRAWIASSLNNPQIPSRFSLFWFCSRN